MSAWEYWPAPVSAGSVYGGAGQTEGHFLCAEALSEAAGWAWTAEVRGRAPVAAAAAGQPGETLGGHRHAGPSVADQTEMLAGQRPGHICFTLQLQVNKITYVLNINRVIHAQVVLSRYPHYGQFNCVCGGVARMHTVTRMHTVYCILFLKK